MELFIFFKLSISVTEIVDDWVLESGPKADEQVMRCSRLFDARRRERTNSLLYLATKCLIKHMQAVRR